MAKISTMSKTQRLAAERARKIAELQAAVVIPDSSQEPQKVWNDGDIRIAFCLYGIVGGTAGKDGMGGTINFETCCDAYRRYIFNLQKTDIFIHTWSVIHEKAIRKIYSPTAAIFEPQIMFYRGKNDGHQDDRFRSSSRWYSTKKVLELQYNYSKENNVNYDFIMITRFDVIWLKELNFRRLEKDCFYVANWNIHPKAGMFGETKTNASFPEGKMKRFSDMWFIGNQEQMNYLSGIYDVIKVIGNPEYDPHFLVFDRMYPKYSDKIKFAFYNSQDYALYRRHLTKDYK